MIGLVGAQAIGLGRYLAIGQLIQLPRPWSGAKAIGTSD